LGEGLCTVIFFLPAGHMSALSSFLAHRSGRRMGGSIPPKGGLSMPHVA
jgi:hypothetical protein